MGEESKICTLCLYIMEADMPYSILSENQGIILTLKNFSLDTEKIASFISGALICKLCEDSLIELNQFRNGIHLNEKYSDNSCNLCLFETESVLIEWSDKRIFTESNINLNNKNSYKVCESCNNKMDKMNNFIKKCASNEEKIKELASKTKEKLTTKDLKTICLTQDLVSLSEKNIIINENEEADANTDEDFNVTQISNTYENKKKSPIIKSTNNIDDNEIPSTSSAAACSLKIEATDDDDVETEELPYASGIDQIDLPPTKNISDITLTINDKTLFVLEDTEPNATQELIRLDGRLDESTNQNLLEIEEFGEETIIENYEEIPSSSSSVKANIKNTRGRKRKNADEFTVVKSEGPKKRGRKPAQRKVKQDTDSCEEEEEEEEEEGEKDNNYKGYTEVVAKKKSPVKLTIIKLNKRRNKAESEKTWRELKAAEAEAAGTSGSAAGDETVLVPVKKRRGRQPNPNKPVKKKKTVIWLYCDQCPFKTYTQNSFIQHQLIHNVMSDLPTLYCDVCRYTTTNVDLMQQHKSTHLTPNLTYKCVFCHDFFKKKASCMYHTLKHDDQDIASQFYCLVFNSLTEEEYFECYQCDFQSVDETPMPDHIIDHTVEVPNLKIVAKFKCDECPYRTKTEEMLIRHKNLHNERNKRKKKPIKKEETLTKAEQIEIKREFTEDGEVIEEPQLPLLKCTQCQYVTRNKRSLSNHIGLKHNRLVPPMVAGETAAAKALKEGQTIFYCNECSYSTYRKLNMPRHMLVHKTKENMELYECPHCIFETKHRRSYTRHLEAKHRVIV